MKKKLKKSLACLLAALLIFSAVPMSALADEAGMPYRLQSKQLLKKLHRTRSRMQNLNRKARQNRPQHRRQAQKPSAEPTAEPTPEVTEEPS